MQSYRDRNRHWVVQATLLCALTGIVLGCGSGLKSRPKVVPVTGSVKYNGKAMAGLTITFSAEGSPRLATGQTDADGKFKLTTFDTNDGAVPGKHEVAISMASSGAAGKKPEDMKPEDLIKMGPQASVAGTQLPAKYADAKNSGLGRTVVDGEVNEFNFDLTD